MNPLSDENVAKLRAWMARVWELYLRFHASSLSTPVQAGITLLVLLATAFFLGAVIF